MEKEEIKAGAKVRHKASGKEETIISSFKFKVNGEWKESVLYQGNDRETGQTALFGRVIDDFADNFEFEGKGDVLEYLVMNFSLEDLKKAVKMKNSICFIKK